MTQHIVVHAGFHKTGTTAIQAFLADNGKHLWPHMALVLPKRIREISRCATMHSTLQDPLSLEEYHTRLTAFLRTIDIGKKRHLLISCEDLAGLIPGRSGHENYDTCPVLMLATKVAIQDVFGTSRPLAFYFSTRQPDAWLRSSYWQHLQSPNMRMDFADYATAHAQAADFAGPLAQTRLILGDTPVHVTPMEDTFNMRFGVASPIIDLFPLPEETLAALAPPTRRNASPSAELMAAFLALNRSGQDADTTDAQKLRLLADYNAAQK